MGTFVNLTGQKFSRLLVIRATDKRSKNGTVFWECLCDCGNTVFVRGSNLRNGHTTSCGCFWKEKIIEAAKISNKTHGMRQSMEYRKWCAMKQRCYNSNYHRYKDHGGRGIRICESWLESFENFYKDMGPCPPGYTIERIDNEGHYCPENSEWAPSSKQARNKRTSKILTLGDISKCVAEWAEIKGCNQDTLGMRVLKGWTHKEALLIPIGVSRKQYYKAPKQDHKILLAIAKDILT